MGAAQNAEILLAEPLIQAAIPPEAGAAPSRVGDVAAGSIGGRHRSPAWRQRQPCVLVARPLPRRTARCRAAGGTTVAGADHRGHTERPTAGEAVFRLIVAGSGASTYPHRRSGGCGEPFASFWSAW